MVMEQSKETSACEHALLNWRHGNGGGKCDEQYGGRQSFLAIVGSPVSA